MRFDEEKMLREGCRNVDEARESMTKFGRYSDIVYFELEKGRHI